MGRWKPDSRGRLQEAALALYSERGFDQTTAAQIATRAGLTERTFFRHFADKREVLFGGSALLQDRIVAGVADAPPTASPLDAVSRGLDAAAAFLGQFRRDLSRQRQIVIAANPELRERRIRPNWLTMPPPSPPPCASEARASRRQPSPPRPA